ncbi:Dihydroorotate dehydrogenase (quinone) [Planctomycetes bacterium Poly30]|uniref:Dihydroorotate dehydrogenase (quinone) n=1 Tax=Saltatorellus ferox TaxID=2528018 RepID=A0A518EY93_9BACT|nr:Dihydroorotate dehydrogenase (quinone) [Planctomycetes bacterium Poly30]
MASLYRALRPVLFRASAETAHHAGIRLGRLGQLAPPLVRALYAPSLSAADRARLRVDVLGQSFPTPVGIAAGLDKNGELVRLWPGLGLGFCEVGSVSALPSAGNPKPRAFRLPEDEALINRMGLNNHGAEAIAARLARTGRPKDFRLAINIAKTHSPDILGDAGIEDFVASTRALLPHADFLVLNVSCPNTAEGKTFESPEALAPLLDAVLTERARQGSKVPVLVKLSPPAARTSDTVMDSGAIDALLDLVLERDIGGFVATNTASDRAGLKHTSAARIEEIGRGGLSGAPIRERANAMVRHLYRRVGDRAVIVGVGGIDSIESAYERVLSGASLIELYTGLVFQGPGLAGEIIEGLARCLERDGFESLQTAVGSRA